MPTVRSDPPSRPALRRRPLAFAIIAAVAVAFVLLPWQPAQRSEVVTAVPGTWEMVETYAPVLSFSSGERTFPAPVGYFLERASLVDLAGAIVAERPEGLEETGSGLYLDFGPADVIDTYERDRPGIANTVYGRVMEVNDHIVLQYWLFYVFNEGRLNVHEGDWEMIQVTLSPDGARAESIALSQHHSGDFIRWDELTAVRDETHPVIMISLGSHANYVPGEDRLDLGDHADEGGEEWSPDNYSLMPIGLGTGENEPSWLRYQGAWGAPAGSLGGLLGKEGPEGPMYREGGRMWSGTGWW
ncbi:MAG: Vps62-related protein [Methanomassiliicoccus sp.]|nr:Vps62-related protein [Methanomassiliicoccus sp.]